MLPIRLIIIFTSRVNIFPIITPSCYKLNYNPLFSLDVTNLWEVVSVVAQYYKVLINNYCWNESGWRSGHRTRFQAGTTRVRIYLNRCYRVLLSV